VQRCLSSTSALRLPHFDQNSLSTYNGTGIVTIEGVIDAPPDERDTSSRRLFANRSPARQRDGTRPRQPDSGHYLRLSQSRIRGDSTNLAGAQASLLSGILLGTDAGLPVVVQEDFRETGTTHIIAISG
jgi:predicted membrane metal-binding protein